jgi:hypothetical protein
LTRGVRSVAESDKEGDLCVIVVSLVMRVAEVCFMIALFYKGGICCK